MVRRPDTYDTRWTDATIPLTMMGTRALSLIHEVTELEAAFAVDGSVPYPENTTNPEFK